LNGAAITANGSPRYFRNFGSSLIFTCCVSSTSVPPSIAIPEPCCGVVPLLLALPELYSGGGTATPGATALGGSG
jgi:hypothetical protein